MIELSWHPGEIPNDIKIQQVYGVMFTRDGRILLQSKIRDGKVYYSLSGGRPEKFDADMYATLRRELVEEVNTTVDDRIYLLGYQKVNLNDGTPPFAQVRMLTLIDKIGKKQPDPDNGETYDRILTSPENAIKYLSWGDIGKQIIEEATKLFYEKFEHDKIRTDDEDV